MAGVTFEGIRKVYPDGSVAVREFNLEVGDGDFMVLVGPSGCGKTTLLRMVAGLEEVTAGEIRIGNEVVNELEPRARDIAMVFQSYALYPHMTVFDNMAFGLRMQRVPKGEIRRRVDEIATVLRLTEHLKRKPGQLSGGQRQRAAMGRAIVRNPKVFLMDEPLSNLDAKLRGQMRAEIARIQRDLRATTIYVTHDQVEAMTMGEEVVVLRKGLLQQAASPQRLYDAPANLFVASFIGSPPMNLVEGDLRGHPGNLVCVLGEQEIVIPAQLEAARPGLASYVGRAIGLGIRPENLHDASLTTGAPESRRLRATVVITEGLGAELLVHLDLAARPVIAEEVLEAAEDIDPAVLEDLIREAGELRAELVGRFDVASNVQTGQIIEVVVDTEKMHFFDLETGLAIGTNGAA